MTTTERPDELVSILSSDFQLALGYAILKDEKSNGVDGGTFTSGAWRTRTLNTEVVNTITESSMLAANQFTLPKGNYVINARAPAYDVAYHILRVQNVTDGATVAEGDSSLFYRTSGEQAEIYAEVTGFFSLSGNKAIELQHICSTTRASSGFGFHTVVAVSNTEVYAVVEIWKVG